MKKIRFEGIENINRLNINRLNFVALIISYFYFAYVQHFFPYHILFLLIGVTISLIDFKYVFLKIDKNLSYLCIFLFLIFLIP